MSVKPEKMRKWFNYILYLSLLFLVISLVRADYLTIPVIHHYPYLILALMLSFVAMLGNIIAWRKVLEIHGLQVPLKESIVAFGLSIFGKYIPGKVWLMMGRASYLNYKLGYSSKRIFSLTVNAQLIILWSGIILGAIGMYAIRGWHLWGNLIAGLWLILTILVFTNWFHMPMEHFISRITGREIKIPRLVFREVWYTLPLFFIQWLIWCAGFYFLTASLHQSLPPWSLSLSFPLATSLGVLAVIVPGGLGVREGVIAGYFLLSGMPVQDAASISLFSRLWYLLSETFIFLTAWVLYKSG